MATYWVTLTGRGQGQVIGIVQSATEPKAQFAGASFSVHGPYTLKQAASYAKSLGGQIITVTDINGKDLGSVDVTSSNPKIGKSQTQQQDNSTGAENKRVQAAGGTLGVNPIGGLQAIAKILGDIGAAITDGKMWRSLGWLVLGILLIFIGIRMWAGTSLRGAAVTGARAVPGLPGKIARSL